MGYPVYNERMESRVAANYLQYTPGRRVALKYYMNIIFYSAKHCQLIPCSNRLTGLRLLMTMLFPVLDFEGYEKDYSGKSRYPQHYIKSFHG